MSDNTNKFVTVACTLFWPKFDKPDQLSEKYGAKLGELSEAAAEILNSWGVIVKDDKPEYGMYISTSSQFPIIPLMENGSPPPGPCYSGTKAHVRLKRREWEYKKKSGVSADPVRVTITEYVGAPEMEPEDEEVF